MKRVYGKPAKKPRVGDRRIVKQFLWMPKTLPNSNGLLEMRWLEEARIVQNYVSDEFFTLESLDKFNDHWWEDKKWAYKQSDV